MKKLLLTLLFCFQAFGQSEIDSFFSEIEIDIGENIEKQEEVVKAKSVPLESEEFKFNDIQVINVTPEIFPVSFSAFIKNESEYGFQSDFRLSGKDFPFLKDKLEKFKAFHPDLSVGFLYDNKKHFQGHGAVNLKFKVEKNTFAGVKLYSLFLDSFNHFQGNVYFASTHPNLIKKNDLVTFYVGAKTPVLTLDDINGEFFKNLTSDFKISENTVFGVYYAPNYLVSDYAFSFEYNDVYFNLTFHKRWL